MRRTLKSIEEVTKCLECMAELMPERAEISLQDQLIDLVWQKIDHPSPMFFLTRPSPVLIFAVTLLLSIYGLWAVQTIMPPRDRAGVVHRQIPIKGAILESDGPVSVTQAGTALKEGSRIQTEAGGSMNLYFPGAGYVYVEEDTTLNIFAARKNWPGRQVEYLLELETGQVLSHLNQMEEGSHFQYQTPFGDVNVTGTDFALASTPANGMKLDVLEGIVETSSFLGDNNLPQKVEKGERALISPTGEGTIYISKVAWGELQQLRDKFNEIFSRAVDDQMKASADSGRNFRILLRKED